MAGKVTPEQRCFLALMRTGSRLQAEGDRFFETITLKQWLVLSQLEGTDRACSLSELQRALGTSHQNIRQIAAKLEKKGYITISPDPDDSRAVSVSLSQETEEMPHLYRYKQISFLRTLFDAIPAADIDATLRVLKKIEGNLDKL